MNIASKRKHFYTFWQVFDGKNFLQFSKIDFRYTVFYIFWKTIFT